MDSRLIDLLRDEIEPIVTGMGFTLVELRHNRSRKQNHIAVIIYSLDGVGVEDCAVVSKNLHPRLELLEGLDNLRLEVSSPGLNRVLKSPSEYEIFKGRGVRILQVGENEWIGGRIDGLRGESVLLNDGGTVKEISLADIRKAKLDESQEVSK
jgi:ribosome maturation factor RimP